MLNYLLPDSKLFYSALAMASDLPPSAIKRERPPGVSPISNIAPAKRQTDELHKAQPTPAKFLWATCQDMNESMRLNIKEVAVEQAEENCLKIQHVLESALGKSKKDAISTGSLAIERKMFKQWIEELSKYFLLIEDARYVQTRPTNHRI